MNIMSKVVPQDRYETLVSRMTDKDHFRPEPAPESQGNLFEPMADLNAIHGGWEPPKGQMVGAGKLIAGSLALTGAALIASRLLRNGRCKREHESD